MMKIYSRIFIEQILYLCLKLIIRIYIIQQICKTAQLGIKFIRANVRVINPIPSDSY